MSSGSSANSLSIISTLKDSLAIFPLFFAKSSSDGAQSQAEGGRDGGYHAGDESDLDCESSKVDEESLMFDAQTALIAHRANLAIKLYTCAALPPYASPQACLALGNLLIRGSRLAKMSSASSPETSKIPSLVSTDSPVLTTPSASPWSRYFPLSTHTSPAPTSPAIERSRNDFIAGGWQIPRDEKRTVCDVEDMGVASAWFILGLAWIVQSEHERQHSKRQETWVRIKQTTQQFRYDTKSPQGERAFMFEPKNLKNSVSVPATAKTFGTGLQSPVLPFSGTTISKTCTEPGKIEKSSPLDTVGVGLVLDTEDEESEILSHIYRLLQPLLRLYTHEHIQSVDPPYLPSLALSQLPHILRPHSERDKGRNAWNLGKVVAKEILKLRVVCSQDGKSPNSSVIGHAQSKKQLRMAVVVLTTYILAMTTQGSQSELLFHSVSSHPLTGLKFPDDLIIQAGKHLKITASCREEQGATEFPFPIVSGPNSADLNRPYSTHLQFHSPGESTGSFGSMTPPPRILKNNKSSVSLATLTPTVIGKEIQAASPSTILLKSSDANIHVSAWNSLKKVQATVELDDWLQTGDEEVEPEDREEIIEDGRGDIARVMARPMVRRTSTSSAFTQTTLFKASVSSIRHIASSPHLASHLSPSSSSNKLQPQPLHKLSTPSRRRLPFEPSSAEAINPIDPALAAAELSSALTKHTQCNVCGMEGVNFPECRKCGERFCSRDCRVGSRRGGDGKKHICGQWSAHLQENN
ncbi:uncharacterized protein L203_100632 [Cryptococcus depauperatus CBS 7841]|uniref:Uncharacterized protein n=1 Tax=Cryptococcus depauperatus CBS 7841 TaxID=1295531 RepID=A0A1E3IX26_9TREE|nr:hypothetical protein L203_00418 [Cryptococcus depauperatus CBS 7841]